MFPKEWQKHSDWESTMRPFLVESSMGVLCFDVVPLMLCDSGRQKRIEFSDVFFTNASDVKFYMKKTSLAIHVWSEKRCQGEHVRTVCGHVESCNVD